MQTEICLILFCRFKQEPGLCPRLHDCSNPTLWLKLRGSNFVVSILWLWPDLFRTSRLLLCGSNSMAVTMSFLEFLGSNHVTLTPWLLIYDSEFMVPSMALIPRLWRLFWIYGSDSMALNLWLRLHVFVILTPNSASWGNTWLNFDHLLFAVASYFLVVVLLQRCFWESIVCTAVSSPLRPHYSLDYH